MSVVNEEPLLSDEELFENGKKTIYYYIVKKSCVF